MCARWLARSAVSSADPATSPVCATPATRVSIVLPVFNEAGNLPEMRSRLAAVFAGLSGHDLEVILVDDHSSDETPRICRAWAAEQAGVQYVRFARNFGSHAACLAGLERATGDVVLLMAADLQDPPEEIPNLLAQWNGGAQVVWAVRTARPGEPLAGKLGARIYYAVMRKMAKVSLPPSGADFAALDRRVVDAVLRCGELNTSLFALIAWMGFRQATVPYVKQARQRGRSGWTLRKKATLFVDSVVGFTFWPVRALSVLGLLMAATGTVYAAYLIYMKLTGQITVAGWTGLMVLGLLGFGAVLAMLGVLGEYLWRTLQQVRARPRFLVEEASQTASAQAARGVLQEDTPAGQDAGPPGRITAPK